MGLRISVYIALEIPRHIIIVLCVYVCLVALRLLFDYENEFVCDIERDTGRRHAHRFHLFGYKV